MRQNPLLQTCALPVLTVVDEFVVVLQNDALMSFSAPLLASTGKDVSVDANVALVALQLGALAKVGTYLEVKGNTALTALDLQGNPNLNLRGAKALIDLLLVNPRWEVPDGHHTPTKSRAGTSIYFHSCVLASSSASC